MTFGPNLLNIRNFLNLPKKKATDGLFRVTVVNFEDRSAINCGLRFAELLKRNSMFDVTFFNESFSKNFLNLQSRNFFDFIDRGAKIMSGTKADILIWGYEEDGKIRLNFQTDNQYAIPDDFSFSLLDSLFVPLNYFTNPESFSESMLLLIYGVIVAAVPPVTNEQKLYKPQVLKDIISLLAADTSQKDIPREFMPYLMNMLGKIYLCNSYSDLTEKDIKIISNLFDTALKNRSTMRLPIYYGCIFNNLGQLYKTAFSALPKDKTDYLKEAISNFQTAQKYLNRNYPYDYGLISYNLALLYFEYWKNNGDLQALRDAVSQLREAEKVYSFAQFPKSWCHIEGLHGAYLSALGLQTKSNEILQFAIEAYQNQQKLFPLNEFPVEWAEIQTKIGNIYYLLGKMNDDDSLMKEARHYFESVQEIYTELNLKPRLKDVERYMKKVKNYLG